MTHAEVLKEYQLVYVLCNFCYFPLPDSVRSVKHGYTCSWDGTSFIELCRRDHAKPWESLCKVEQEKFRLDVNHWFEEVVHKELGIAAMVTHDMPTQLRINVKNSKLFFTTNRNHPQKIQLVEKHMSKNMRKVLSHLKWPEPDRICNTIGGTYAAPQWGDKTFCQMLIPGYDFLSESSQMMIRYDVPLMGNLKEYILEGIENHTGVACMISAHGDLLVPQDEGGHKHDRGHLPKGSY